ncbi:BREX system serine/threonine kinase PglW [Marinobacter sp. ELB17]|uniref:BREX system serine/threonine kinase PglW n=1 Tax=Marinobacter sp. ELB17 TaxID=270374 RepID=UPI0000F3A3BB|nr:BREX system serine/threonine kinase PglW [Marinobacter sp. ELB17]EAZ99557.1 Serine/threonine protein kinase [Marinobacter sp. ELB17]
MDMLWKQITQSDYAWEIEALEFAKQLLPDHDPYRAWANFEFIALDGSINEVDLMVLTPKGMYLIEIKSHPGVIRGDASNWVWEKPKGGQKIFDNPRLLTRRKAQKLASLLKVQASVIRSKERVPFIEALVFLSAENLTIKLDDNARQGVVNRTELLPELTQVNESWSHKQIPVSSARVITRAVEEAGIKESLRMRRVGSYELKHLLSEADNFQEWYAVHSELGVERKVRIYLTQGKAEADVKRLEKAAQLEFRLLEGIEHPGIMRAKDYLHHDSGPALVYEYDPMAFRLDHLLMNLGQSRRLETTQALYLLRLIAEAVKYAHGQKLFHRGLSPQSVWVKPLGDEKYDVKISNWATAERVYENETRHITAMSHLSQFVQEDAGCYAALEAHGRAADGVHLDVFSLGAIAYHLFTGKKPAESDIELLDKLRHSKGLQVTDEINGASEGMQYLVQYATHPDVGSRLESVTDFLQHLDVLEDEISQPDTLRSNNPTEARKGDTFAGGFTVVRPLGKGACSVVFQVQYQGQDRVLKIAATPDHNSRLIKEGNVLAKLRHQSIVAYHKTLDIGGHTALLLDYASEGTLAQRLRHVGAVQLELLERFGDDLLSAIAHLEDQALVHRDIKPENLGLVMQGSALHLILFDFSLSSVGADNVKAGTLAYMDPFIRDPGRRRWDDHAERFSAALTLYEMAAGALPGWAVAEGLPPLLEGELEVDRTLFDPSIRDRVVDFFKRALIRDARERFASAGDMLREWRKIFHQARTDTQHSTVHPGQRSCPINEARLDTQIGLLELSPQALDTLSRRNINTVAELIKLNRSRVRVLTGVGVKTRNELSEVIGQLQERLLEAQQRVQFDAGDTSIVSVDRLFQQILPKVTKATDPTRLRFLHEYLGRLDDDSPRGLHNVHWPTPAAISGYLGIETLMVRELISKVSVQWGKTKTITDLREDIAGLLEDNGGVMTAVELADAVLLRRGSVQDSPLRERWAYAVVRAAVETELSKQEPRWLLRRSGSRILIADNRQGWAEELADYANDLGDLADECANQYPLLSPVRALERIRAVPAPESFSELSNPRLSRLAAAASQQAALSSRAEFYPRGLPAKRALELAQGALLGSKALAVQDVQARVAGRYPAAEALPKRPQLDALVLALDIGFKWDAQFEFSNGNKGAYCLPSVGLTSFATGTTSYSAVTQQSDEDSASLREVKELHKRVQQVITASHFLALTVRPRQWQQAQLKLCADYPFKLISFDELLLRHVHQVCSDMPRAPDWQVVLNADSFDRASRDWQNLQRLVHRALPAMTQEILTAGQPVLLTDPGLMARYDLIGTWLADLRMQLMQENNGSSVDLPGLALLIAADDQFTGAAIDGSLVPTGAGSKEYARIPGSWFDYDVNTRKEGAA